MAIALSSILFLAEVTNNDKRRIYRILEKTG